MHAGRAVWARREGEGSSHITLSHPNRMSPPPPLSAPQGEGSQPFSDKMSRLLAGLQRKESLGFLVDGFGRLLRNSHESQTTYLPSSRVQLECEQVTSPSPTCAQHSS